MHLTEKLPDADRPVFGFDLLNMDVDQYFKYVNIVFQ